MANENPIPLKSGDAVVVKFAPGTIGERNQGKGWHDARVVLADPVADYILVDLIAPTKGALTVFGSDFATCKVSIHMLTDTDALNKLFRGTVVRKVSKDKKYTEHSKKVRRFKA